MKRVYGYSRQQGLSTSFPRPFPGPFWAPQAREKALGTRFVVLFAGTL